MDDLAGYQKFRTQLLPRYGSQPTSARRRISAKLTPSAGSWTIVGVVVSV
jgi:hypothetical protein